MNTAARVIVIGAGLSGLYAAHLLARRGVRDYLVLEARDRPGGRILGAGPYDLGPAWFWPEVQPELDRVIRQLGLARDAQYERGAMRVERGGPVLSINGYASYPASVRLAGGMRALTDALCRGLDPARLRMGHAVSRLRVDAGGVEVETTGPANAFATHAADHVLLALPPRLALATIAFTPGLPPMAPGADASRPSPANGRAPIPAIWRARWKPPRRASRRWRATPPARSAAHSKPLR